MTCQNFISVRDYSSEGWFQVTNKAALEWLKEKRMHKKPKAGTDRHRAPRLVRQGRFSRTHWPCFLLQCRGCTELTPQKWEAEPGRNTVETMEVAGSTASLLLREFFLDLAQTVNKPADLSRSIDSSDGCHHCPSLSSQIYSLPSSTAIPDKRRVLFLRPQPCSGREES